MIKSPILKYPHKVVLVAVPDVSGNQKCRPYLEVVNGIDFQLVRLYSWFNR